MISNSVVKNTKGIFCLKRLSIDFTKYSLVGFLVTIANVFLMWLFIDILKIYTLLASSIVVIGLHIVKFIAYKKVKLIRKQFIKYTIIQSSSGLLNIIGVWFLIDILHLPTVFSSMSVVAILFILRFILFKITKLIIE